MNCFLCFKISDSCEGSISFDSTDWIELNIEYIVEKHLWKMDNLNNNSLLCHTCWRELHNFHNFYLNIEKAHTYSNVIIKSEIILEDEENSQDELGTSLLKDENPVEICLEKNVDEKPSLKKRNYVHNFQLKRNKNNNKTVVKTNQITRLKKDGDTAETNKSEDNNRNQNSLKICLTKDVESKPCLKKRTKRKLDLKKCKNNKKYIRETNQITQLEKDKNATETSQPGGNSLEIVIQKDVMERSILRKSTECKIDLKRYKINGKNITKNKPKLLEKNKETVETDKEKNNLYGNRCEVYTENDSKEIKLDENLCDQNDSFESDDDDPLSALVNSLKLEQLKQEQDKFIAENFQINCSLCEISLGSYATMSTHYKEKHNQRGYATCCNQKLHSRTEIVDHIELHKNPECFKCRQCDKKLCNRSGLKLHIKNVHEKKVVKCEICGKSLASELSLRTHKILHEDYNKDKLRCKQCDKYYVTKATLNKHIRNVHLKNNIICDICGKLLADSYCLSRHMLKHEGKVEPKVSCEICGRILSDIRCLKRHMRLKHPPDGVRAELNCHMCSKVFASTAYLKMHIRRVHEHKYARKCELCEKTFKSPAALKDHMGTHSGRPVSACGFCSRTFYSNGNMHAHRKRMHPAEWKESMKKYFSENLTEKDVTNVENENLNNHSYICQKCWYELHNFHNFYLNIEKAQANLNIIKAETVSDDVLNDKGEHIISGSINNTHTEPETLFLKEENPSEIYEKEEEENFRGFENTTTTHTNSIVKVSSASDIQNIVVCTTEEKEIEKASFTEKCSKPKDFVKETINGKENNTKHLKIRLKKITVTTEINKQEVNKNQDYIGIQMNKRKDDPNKAMVIDNCSEQDDSLESDDDDPLSSLVDSFKLERFQQKQDKFIAENFQINCSLCEISLASFAIMSTHYKEEHDQRGYATCCNQKLHSRSEIVDHIKVHQDPEYFKCKKCGKISINRVCLKLHIKNVHEEKNFKCDTCGKSLANKSSLKTHKLLHDADNVAKLPCEQCDKLYTSKRALNNHIRIVHSQKYLICDVCGKSMSTSYKFKVHMLKHEGKSKPPVICKFCGRTLSDISCLNRHIRSLHPPNGIQCEIKCPMCTTIFKNNANLQMHIRTLHEKKYEKKCTICGKTFIRLGALKDHMSLHIGKPKHACGFCPKIFYSSGNMHTHRKTMHPKEWQLSVSEKFRVNLTKTKRNDQK